MSLFSPLRRARRTAFVAGLSLAALTACAHGLTAGPEAALPTEAAQRFLAAAQNQDLRALMTAWGTRDKTVAQMARKDRSWQLRGETLLCLLHHDSSTVRLRAIRSEEERRLAVMLFRGGRTMETTITTVQTHGGGWRVSDVDVQPLITACAPGRRP